MKLSAAPLFLCLLIHLVACDKVNPHQEIVEKKEISEQEKITALREMKQKWVDHKDRFPAIQKQIQNVTAIIYSVSLKAYDPSIRMPNNNEVAFVEAPPITGVGPFSLFKVMLKPRGLVNQKVEQGAFEIANFLKMPELIPPTVRFNANGKNGVLSYFIDVDQEVQNPWAWKYKYSDKFESIEPLLGPKSLNNFYTFAHVLGLWDLKWVNTLLVGQFAPYTIVSLDNESLMSPVYASEGEHFYVCWKQDLACPSCPYEDLSTIEVDKFILKKEEIPDRLEDIKRFFIKDKSIQELAQEEQEKIIIKRMVSFLWGKNSIPCFIGKKGLWLQLYADYPLIPAPKPQLHLLDSETIVSLKGLHVSQLRGFFEDLDEEKPLFSTNHYEGIIARAHLLLERDKK